MPMAGRTGEHRGLRRQSHAPAQRPWRVVHESDRVELWIPSGDRLWELSVPLACAPAVAVRVRLREIGARRGAEASALLDAQQHSQTIRWLACLPDGPCSPGEVPPALAPLADAFGPILGVLGALRGADRT